MNLKYLVKYIEKKSFLCLLLQEDLIFEDVDEIVDDELQKINFSMLSNNARVKIVKQCNKFLFYFSKMPVLGNPQCLCFNVNLSH